MRGELIRESLHRGDRVYGTHVCSLSNPVAAKIQASFDYDFVFICNEHMPIDRTETAMMCQYYASMGKSPIVRIPYPSPHEASMALDAGAQGIVVPYIEKVDEVEAIVGAVKYRPIKGKQLQEFLGGRRQPTQKTIDFLNKFNRDNYLIIGIESVAAYENLDALLSVPGIDSVFMGPHDLTVSMEIPEEYDNPTFLNLVSNVIRRSRAAGLGVGIHLSQMISSDELFIRFMEEGMNWILYGADISMLGAAMKEHLGLLRSKMGDRYLVDGSDNTSMTSCLFPTGHANG